MFVTLALNMACPAEVLKAPAKMESLQVKLQVKKFCASPNDVCGLWENSLRVGGTVFRQNQAVSFVKSKPHIAEKVPSFGTSVDSFKLRASCSNSENS